MLEGVVAAGKTDAVTERDIGVKEKDHVLADTKG
jgi:hypothetical protein